MAQSIAKVFISHSHHDHDAVRELEASLERAHVEAWAYEGDLRTGGKIREQVETQLQRCDHLIVFLSESSRRSDWVARELGFALARQRRLGELYPSIIGVQAQTRPESFEYVPRDFETGEPFSEPYDFTGRRRFDLTAAADRLQDLVRNLLPRTTVITETDGEQGRLLRASFSFYIELFPDEADRDDPDDIIEWIDASARRRLTGMPWQELYAVHHIGDYVIGIFYLSANVDRDWCFGNYFAVRRAWRQKRRSIIFLENVANHLRTAQPNTKGIIFEVDPIDLEYVKALANREQLMGHGDETRVIRNLRNCRRVVLFRSYGAKTFLASDGSALPYWQPAMVEPLAAEDERQLALMVYPMSGVDPGAVDLHDVLAFVYDDLYGDAYGPDTETEIPGFLEYCAGVKARVERAAKHGWTLGRLSVPSIQTLVKRAREEGWSQRIAL